MTKALQITTEITNQICEKLMSGVPLTRICEAKDLPSLSTVHRLINKDPSFAKQIIQARKVGCQYCKREAASLSLASIKAVA